ncbi:MAG: hypothetical protein ACXWPI_15880 [Ktedonobacterales bacterium]
MLQALQERPRQQLRANAIPVALSDRWYILGRTGTGKTTFAKRLVQEMRTLYPWVHLYALDSKGGDDFQGWPGVITSEEPPAPLPPVRGEGENAGLGDVQVWQPPDDDHKAYDAWLHGILKARQPAIVYIDELSSLAANQSGTSYPIGLPKLLKQGRSLGICTVILSQEAAYIPRQVRMQTTHFTYFRLQDDPHGIQQAMRLLGFDPKTPREPQERYGFFYRRLNPVAGPVDEYTGMQEFFDG